MASVEALRATRACAVVLAVTALLAGCSSRTANADGWWDEGVHAIDGYWVVSEGPCESVAPDCSTAISIWNEAHPGISVDKVSTGTFPIRHGKTPDEITAVTGGLSDSRLVILDVADGTRRAIALLCGPEGLGSPIRIVCHPASFTLWQVRQSPEIGFAARSGELAILRPPWTVSYSF